MAEESGKDLLSLVGSLCNCTITPDEAAKLNDLLANDTQARSLYRDYLQVHLVLVEQVRNDAARADTPPHSLATMLADDLLPNSGAPTEPLARESLARSEAADGPTLVSGIRGLFFGSGPAAGRYSVPAFAASAAMVLFAAGFSYLLWTVAFDTRLPDEQLIANSNERGSAKIGSLLADPGCDELLVVRDSKALRLLSHLTRTASLFSLQLPRKTQLDDLQEITLCSGAAWMERGSGQRERGYVVGLPPTCSLQVYVDTNAAGQNSLSIIQLDDHGNPVGGAMSFNNVMEGDATDVVTKQLGCIGNYLDFNEGFTTKYYLLTGSYNDPELSTDNTWSQSDYKVQFQSDDVLVIGWDDTRYIPPLPAETEDFKHDCDFNDIRAIIRLSDSESLDPRREATVDYSPAPVMPPDFAAQRQSGYAFEVGPGDELVLVVSSAASMETAVQICQLPSRQIIWQQNSPRSRETSESEHTSHKVYVIRNFTGTVQRYELNAEYQAEAGTIDKQWHDWPFELLADEEGTVTIGFNDNSVQPSGADWPGVTVHARWFRN